MLFTTTCDWDKPILGWMYTLFFVFLGSSAAIWGGWLERAGPRKAGVVAAFCWCGGLVLSAIGVYTHQLWLMWLGSGVIGGVGLGLGYISPVSTLIKWFPDRRGMATGMAIMGFGGGAMIGSPLAAMLMKYYATPTSVGVWETFVTMAAIYFVFMMIGALAYRVPPTGWKPAGWTPPASAAANTMITHPPRAPEERAQDAAVLAAVGHPDADVSAGIGVIGMASPMLQEIFGGQLIGLDLKFDALSKEQLGQIAVIAAAFTGLLSLFNIAGAVFSGLRCPTTSGARRRISPFLRWDSSCTRRHRRRACRQHGIVRRILLHHPDHVRRRVRHHSRLSRGHVRHADGRRHPRAGC